MIRKNSIQFEKKLNEIDDLIHRALEHNFLSDQLYTEITTKIGTFDEAFLNSPSKAEDANFLPVKKHLDEICDALMIVHSYARKSQILNSEDFMHPTGDSFNEDNSIFLSKRIKEKLKKILDEKCK